MKRLLKKFASLNSRLKTAVLLSALLITIPPSILTINFIKKKMAEINVKNHDDALLTMNNIIIISEEVQNYYKKLYAKKKKEKLNVSHLNKTSLNCEITTNSLKTLNNHKDPLVQELISTSESLKVFFEQEAARMSEVNVVLAIFKLNRTIDPASLTRIKMNEMQNEKIIQKSIESLKNISIQFFEQNKRFLNESEKNILSSQIYLKFKDSIDKYLELRKKTEDWSTICMYDYEWVLIFMYLSINA